MVAIWRNIFIVLFSVIILPGLFSFTAEAQYLGGNGDGMVLVSFESTTCPTFHCSGGNGDGVAGIFLPNSISNGIYCSGGDGNGEAMAYVSAVIAPGFHLGGGDHDGMGLTSTLSSISQPLYCYGGNDDGFASIFYTGLTSGTGIYCLGGDHDGGSGLSINSTVSQTFYCQGGLGDGQVLLQLQEFALGMGLWNGYVNSNWFNVANWTNNVVPGPTTQVVIPGGCINYPILADSFSINNNSWGEIRCSQLDIDTGATFTSSNQVNVNGLLNISGEYFHTATEAFSFQISDQGIVNVKSTGSFLLQP